MLTRKELRFERGSILTAAQLRTIEKFPREFLRLMYSEYGDGIISGMNYIERDDEIYLTEGLVKLGDKFFFSAETNLSELMTGTTGGRRYKFILSEPQRTADNNIITEEISLEVRELEKAGSLEFGRFKAGLVRLPKLDAKDLFEEFTRTSRLNLINVPYAVRGGVTFVPHIFQAILSRLEHKKNPAPADIALMIQLTNVEAVSMKTLELYVLSKVVKWHGDSRENIFKSVISAVDKDWEINLPEKISAPKDESKPDIDDYDGIFI